MEDDANQSHSNMVPTALALLGIVLGSAGLYFGLTANQRLNPIDESVSAGATSSAKIEKVINGFQTQVTEFAAQIAEQSKTVSRLRVYSSQGEQAVKKLAGELNTNREQIVKTAEMLNEFAAAGFSAAPSTQLVSAASNNTGSQPSTAAPRVASSYVIVPGDNFGKIAGKFGVPVQAIIDANPDANPRRLAIGQTIQIPTK